MHSGSTSHYLDWHVAINKINKHIQIGNKFLKTEQYFQALENYEDAKKYYASARTPDKKILVTILCKLAICEIKLNKNYDQARSYIDEILGLCASQNELTTGNSYPRKPSLSATSQNNSPLVKATIMDKNEISESYYEVGKICLKYLNDDALTNACFINALALLGSKNPETTPPFSRNTIHLPMLKIDLELARFLVKKGKTDEAVNAIENGAKTLHSIIESTPIAVHKEGYRQLYSKLFALLKEIAPDHKILETSIFETTNPLFNSRKHQTTKADEINSDNISVETKSILNENESTNSNSSSMCLVC